MEVSKSLPQPRASIKGTRKGDLQNTYFCLQFCGELFQKCMEADDEHIKDPVPSDYIPSFS